MFFHVLSSGVNKSLNILDHANIDFELYLVEFINSQYI